MRHVRSIPAVLALLAVVPLLLAADCESERALVSFTVFRDSGLGIDPDQVTIRFSHGGTSRVVTGEDFEGTSSRFDTREFRTPTSGTLIVDVTIAEAGEVIATGMVELPLRPDWGWGVDLFLGDRNPTDTCFGCVDYRAFGVAEGHRDSPADSLWVVWGGNSISNPVVF